MSEPGVDLQGLPAGGPVLASKTLQDRRALVDISHLLSLALAFSVIINEPTLPCLRPQPSCAG